MQTKFATKYLIWKKQPQVLRLAHLLLFLLTINLASCATAPKSFNTLTSGQWEARALVKDKVKSKKYIINLDFLAERPSNLRMEITSTVGQHLGSFAMNTEHVSYYLSKEKKYFKGKPTPDNFKPVFGYALDPKLLNNILFDEPIPQKDWSCTMGAEGVVADCKGRDNLSIVWSERSGEKRSVLISSKKFEVQLQFHRFEKPEKFDPSTFEIQKP